MTIPMGDLEELVQHARDCALTGNYDNALQKYEQALKTIEKHINRSEGVVSSCRSEEKSSPPSGPRVKRKSDRLRKPGNENDTPQSKLSCTDEIERKIDAKAWRKTRGRIREELEYVSKIQQHLKDLKCSPGLQPDNTPARNWPQPTPQRIIKSSVEQNRAVRDQRRRSVPQRRTPSRKSSPPRTRERKGKSQGDALEPYSVYMKDSSYSNLIREIEDSTMLKDGLETKLEDIGGLEGVKSTLYEAVAVPGAIPELFQGLRRPWQGILLFGPPGTGKSMLAKAVASMSDSKFFSVTASDVASKWRGESEKSVRILFDMARYYAPSVIFIDEIDSIATQRGGASEHEASLRVKTELFTQMDGVRPTDSDASKRVVVIAATNNPETLDGAIRRRFEKRIYIPLPDLIGRKLILKKKLEKDEVRDDVDLDELAKLTEGYSGADLAVLCKEAAHGPLRRVLDQVMTRQDGEANFQLEPGLLRERFNGIRNQGMAIEWHDFETALEKVKSSVQHSDLEKYEKFKQQFGAT